MEELCIALSESYMEKNPNVTVTTEYIGSTAGIEALLSGAADIGTSSRNLTQEEKDQGVVENVVAKDGIAVIVNPAVTGVEALSSQQIADIYIRKHYQLAGSRRTRYADYHDWTRSWFRNQRSF